MTDHIPHPDDADTPADDYQHAVEACEHAADALHTGNLSHAQRLLDEARTAVEYAQHDDSDQVQRETAWDCYD